MEDKAGEKDVTEVYVYVGKDGKANLKRGIDQGIWGWKCKAVESPGYQDLLTSLKAGDRLFLGHLGLGRISAEKAYSRTVPMLVATTLTGEVYQDQERVWNDESEKVSYPFRVNLQVDEVRYDVTRDDIGLGAIDALRRSAIANGAPEPNHGSETALEDTFNAFLESQQKEEPGGKSHQGKAGGQKEIGGAWDVHEFQDDEDPADRILDLPASLDLRVQTLARFEQKKLRREMLKGRTEVACDLCQTTLPKRLVHTAHIKRRSVSSHLECSDLNNLMFACVLGCDSLFEHGYVYVDTDGAIKPTAEGESTWLSQAVQRLGGSCSAFSEKNAPYYAWHRENIANVKEG